MTEDNKDSAIALAELSGIIIDSKNQANQAMDGKNPIFLIILQIIIKNNLLYIYILIIFSLKIIKIKLGDEFFKQIGGIICFKCQTEKCDCPLDKETSKAQKKRMRRDVIKNIEVFKKISDNLDVLYNAKQEHKLAIVIGLKQLCYIVASTGSQPHDYKVLKTADVGLTYGQNSSDMVREAASIILTDNNFKSITAAIIYGRNIYDSVQKFIQFQMTANFTIVFCTFLGAIIMKQEIISPI